MPWIELTPFAAPKTTVNTSDIVTYFTQDLPDEPGTLVKVRGIQAALDVQESYAEVQALIRAAEGEVPFKQLLDEDMARIAKLTWPDADAD